MRAFSWPRVEERGEGGRQITHLDAIVYTKPWLLEPGAWRARSFCPGCAVLSCFSVQECWMWLDPHTAQTQPVNSLDYNDAYLLRGDNGLLLKLRRAASACFICKVFFRVYGVKVAYLVQEGGAGEDPDFHKEEDICIVAWATSALHQTPKTTLTIERQAKRGWKHKHRGKIFYWDTADARALWWGHLEWCQAGTYRIPGGSRTICAFCKGRTAQWTGLKPWMYTCKSQGTLGALWLFWQILGNWCCSWKRLRAWQVAGYFAAINFQCLPKSKKGQRKRCCTSCSKLQETFPTSMLSDYKEYHIRLAVSTQSIFHAAKRKTESSSQQNEDNSKYRYWASEILCPGQTTGTS